MFFMVEFHKVPLSNSSLSPPVSKTSNTVQLLLAIDTCKSVNGFVPNLELKGLLFGSARLSDS